MKINNLKVGQVVKNYKELCKLLELKPQGGNAKKKQMAWIEEYVNYEKDGYKFIINEISGEDVEPMVDKRDNPIEYLDLLEKLILDLMLQDEKDNKIYLSKTQMFRQLRMANINYGAGKLHVPELSELIDVNKKTAEDWYNSTDSMLERHITKALQSLTSQALIVWQKVTTVDVNTVTGEAFVQSGETSYDSEGNDITTYDKVEITKHEHREATEKEDLIIVRAEREALEKMGYNNKSSVILGGEWANFETTVKDIIRKEGNINYYYKSYKILFHNDIVQKRVNQLDEMLLNSIERATTQKKLNLSIQGRVLDNAKTRKNGAMSYFGKSHNHRALDSYIPDTIKLSDILLSPQSENLTKELRRLKKQDSKC